MRFTLLLVGALALAAAAMAAEPSFALLREVPLSGKFQDILGFDVAPDGGVVIVDRDAPAITSFDKEGHMVRSYSHPGTRHCEIATPEAVAVTPHGIAVWDQKRHHLLRFTTDGVCVADDVVLDYEVDRGALARAAGGFVTGGDTLTGPPCALLFIADAAPAQVKSCLHAVADQPRWLLYGRSYVATRAGTAYFAVPYESTVWMSGGLHEAAALRASAGRIPQHPIPEDERQIRSTRSRYYDFYASRRVVEGLAAVDRGVVLVTAQPSGSRREITMTLLRDDGSEAATTTLPADGARGVYAAHVRGDGRNRVYLLLAHGAWPAAVNYSVAIYEIR